MKKIFIISLTIFCTGFLINMINQDKLFTSLKNMKFVKYKNDIVEIMYEISGYTNRYQSTIYVTSPSNNNLSLNTYVTSTSNNNLSLTSTITTTKLLPGHKEIFPLAKDLPYYINTSDIPSNNYEEGPPKTILFWRPRKGWDYTVGRDVFKRCRVSNCIGTLDRNQYDYKELDAIVFLMHPRNMPLIDVPPQRWPGTRYIFLQQESPIYTQPLNNYDGFFNWTMTFRLDSDVPIRYGYTLRRSNHLEVADNQASKRSGKKLVAWMASHCITRSQRKQYVKELRKYIPVDIYGRCGRLRCSKDNYDQCRNDISQNYKFYLAFENSLCKDYVTEKFFETLQFGPVPVVWGSADYKEHAPPKSYINVQDFHSPRDLANYLLYLDKNDSAYNTFYLWHRDYEVVSEKVRYRGWCDLCARLHSDHTPKVKNNLEQWYKNNTCISKPYNKLYKDKD